MGRWIVAAAGLAALAGTAAAQPASPRAPGARVPAPSVQDPGLQAFRATYKELVEINTTLSSGSCTAAAQAMGKRLTDAGYPAADVRVAVPEGRPKDGALLAVLRSPKPSKKPVLLLAHIDVVEARREDWTRDPFTLVEEGGFFYGRGTFDDKAMAAIFVDTLVRYRQEGFRPNRDIKLALTCGEETADTFNGVDHLLKTEPQSLDAAFVINEGGGGRLDAAGKPATVNIQVGEKLYQDYTLEATGPGGHSSRPSKGNPLVRLSQALARVDAHDFPPELNEVTRQFLLTPSADYDAEEREARRRLATSREVDVEAARVLSASPSLNSTLRTTCVPTLADAGHAPNAIPQRARANVNCRIFPGHDPEAIRAELERVVADPEVKVTLAAAPSPVSKTPPLTSEVLDPIKATAAKIFPGVPTMPFMATGATDGRYLNARGVPTYGVSGLMSEDDGSNGTHGLNERIRVKSLYDGRTFLHALVRAYAGG